MKKNKIRNLLLCLSLKFNGDTRKIYKFLEEKKPISDEEIENTIKDFKGNFITFIDEEYPEVFKSAINPPAVLFYEGNLDLLKDNENNNGLKLATFSRNDSSVNYKKETIQILSCLKEDDTLVLVDDVYEDTFENFEESFDKDRFYTKANLIKITRTLNLKETSSKDISYIDNNKKLLLLSQSYEQNFTIDRYHLAVNLADKTFVITATEFHRKALEEVADTNKELFVMPTSVKHTRLINNDLIYNGAWAIYSPEQFKLHLEQEEKVKC